MRYKVMNWFPVRRYDGEILGHVLTGDILEGESYDQRFKCFNSEGEATCLPDVYINEDDFENNLIELKENSTKEDPKLGEKILKDNLLAALNMTLVELRKQNGSNFKCTLKQGLEDNFNFSIVIKNLSSLRDNTSSSEQRETNEHD